MSCNCGSCVSRGFICVPRGDDMSILFSVRDDDDDEFDISGASEITFIVAAGVWIGGSITPGGAVLLEKRLTDGEITIAGTGFQFVVDIDGADTADFTQTNNYYEVRVETSGGNAKTVSAGLFKSENTMIKDIV